MKCPVCQAQLMPVAGELFCLQCGEAVHVASGDGETVDLRATTEPILQRAIVDATHGEMRFETNPVLETRAAPVPIATAQKPPVRSGHTFASLRAALAPPRAALVATGGPVTMAEPVLPGASHSANVGAEPKALTSGLINLLAARTDDAARPTEKSPRSKGMMIAWVSGILGLLLFVGVNVLAGNYYANRVYPGIRVGNVAVGGLRFDELNQALMQRLPAPQLAVVIDKERLVLDTAALGALKLDEAKRTVQSASRTPMLPVAAVVGSWFSKPITVQYDLNEAVLSRVASEVAAKADEPVMNAVPMVVGTQVFVMPERPGRHIDATGASMAIRNAYGHVTTVTLLAEKLAPTVVSADYADEVTFAQGVIGVSVAATVRKVRYSPSADQLGQWLVFDPAGKGVVVDAASVAAYVRSMPGSFDKLATYNAFMAGLNVRQAVVYTPSIKKVTEVPTVPQVAAVLPLVEYRYCADENNDLLALSGQVLASNSGWTLGGKIRYKATKVQCSLRLQLADQAAMKALDPACEHQTSCRIHNDLALSRDHWLAAPAGWKGDLMSYRTELINQVVGQWLGFDHPACLASAAQTPVLEGPSVMVAGCSPKWYVVPIELQDTKVLSGF